MFSSILSNFVQSRSITFYFVQVWPNFCLRFYLWLDIETATIKLWLFGNFTISYAWNTLEVVICLRAATERCMIIQRNRPYCTSSAAWISLLKTCPLLLLNSYSPLSKAYCVCSQSFFNTSNCLLWEIPKIYME